MIMLVHSDSNSEHISKEQKTKKHELSFPFSYLYKTSMHSLVGWAIGHMPPCGLQHLQD